MAIQSINIAFDQVKFIFSGGQIHDIHASFLHQYKETKEPINIVISCGVENIINRETPWSIIFQVR